MALRISDLLSVRDVADLRLSKESVWRCYGSQTYSVKGLGDCVADLRLSQPGVCLTVLPISDLLSQGSS